MDLAQDRGSIPAMDAEQPEVVERIKPDADASRSTSQEELERLRALGYIQ